MNDGIDPALTSLTYITVDSVMHVVQQLGKGSLLAKMDTESAYVLVPVHPQDRILQAVEWDGQIYVDPMLPFGLRSAQIFFTAVADMLNWCLQRAGIRFVSHYLDDFIVTAPPQSEECQRAVEALNLVCAKLGVPTVPHKWDGPTTCLIFLGIQIDIIAGELRLPEEKLQRLRTLLREWSTRKSCQWKQLESLIGLLTHACKVVCPGRSFLCRLPDFLHATGSRPDGNSTICLNKECWADVAWWEEFVGRCNGRSFLCTPPHNLPMVEMASDAFGSWGCGAWHGSSWFQVPWDDSAHTLSIAAKELIPIFLACVAWGHTWHAHQVRCWCNNQVVVAALQVHQRCWGHAPAQVPDICGSPSGLSPP